VTDAAAGRSPGRSFHQRALSIAAVVLLATAAIPLVLKLVPHRSGPTGPPVVSAAGLLQRSGVRIVRVTVSGDGGLVDLRYQVADSDKAAALHDPANPPLVVDERTGGVVSRLFMGHTHSQPPKVGLTYYLIFENPGDLVRAGKMVSVQLGDARVAHVRVQ
jgi:hypothetical protein